MWSVVQKCGPGATRRLEVDPQVSPGGARCEVEGTEDVLEKPEVIPELAETRSEVARLTSLRGRSSQSAPE